MKQIFLAKSEVTANMSKNSFRVSPTSRVFVLCAVSLAQNFLPVELSSPFIVLLGSLLMIFGKIQIGYLKLVWPLLVVLVIGFIGTFNHESRDILRDIAFALTPLSLIFIGYWLANCNAMWPLILKIMVIIGFVLATVHLFVFVLNPELLSADLNDVRKISHGSGILVVLALILGLLQKHLGIKNLFPRLLLLRFIVIPVLLASFVLSYSRTSLIVAVILTLALLGVLSGVSRRLVFTVGAIMVGFIAITAVTPEDEIGTFRSKLVRSFTEIAVSDYDDLSDINKNWRGFEAQKAFDSFSSGNAFEWIVGQGFGALADLGFYIALGAGWEDDEKFRYIPLFHNGYAYILLKTGLLGVACYMFFYTSVIMSAVHESNSINSAQRFFARLLLGSVLSLVLTMIVVGGMAEMHESELVLLLGYLVRRLEQSQIQKSRIGVVRIG